MSRHGTIRRYTLILEKLKRKQYPSFKEIREYLFNYGFEISSRTIQRDIEQIRFEFGIEIKYSRLQNGYYIDYNDSINIESFLKFLEIVNTAELLTESLRDSKDALDYILFENQGSLKGLENLKKLLQSILEKRIISFSYYNYVTERKKDFIIQPYLLREYQDRWYIIGIIKNTKKFRTFGVDRIENLKMETVAFKRNKHIDASKFFENIVGVNYSDKKIEKVVLSFSPLQGEYIKSLPIHASQKVIIDNDEELRIELTIVPNFEFNQKILSYGKTVKVLQPKWLADNIKEELQQAIDNYS